MANAFHFGMRTRGIMASYHPLFLSSAHTRDHVTRVLEAAEDVLKKMQ
jgi:glutamate-1-semialdehyde aminotransferase